MSYALGIDLGTTFTAAAVAEPGRRADMLSLGSNSYTIPSVLFLREDGSFLSGESAEIRALAAPTRVARHFKRQLGSPGSAYIAGTPYSPQTLTSHLLKAVLDLATTRQGEEPETVVLTHPANWGPYRREVFEQAAAMAGVRSKLVLISEPEAAAIHYASSEKIAPGELIAVYDLGGGTFDAVVMRRTEMGFEVVGQPQGVERLGGVDFDDVIWGFVTQASELDVRMLADSDDEAVLAAGHELRANCVKAKRLLSADTSADIRVALPSLNRTVRLNRDEFESRIRPRLVETIAAMENAFRSGGVTPPDISRILLVGGSSRIPLVGQLLIQHFGRPLAIDSDPKNTVALGAAMRGTLAAPDPSELPSAQRGPDVDLSERSVPVPPEPLDPTIDLTEPPAPKAAPARLAGSVDTPPSPPSPGPAQATPPSPSPVPPSPGPAAPPAPQPSAPAPARAEATPPTPTAPAAGHTAPAPAPQAPAPAPQPQAPAPTPQPQAPAPTPQPQAPQPRAPAPPAHAAPPPAANPPAAPPTVMEESISMPSTESATNIVRAESEPATPAEPAQPPSELGGVLSESNHRVVLPNAGAKKENPFSAANEAPLADVQPVTSGSRTAIIAVAAVLILVIVALAATQLP